MEFLFNAFATAAFFKFVVFSIFEMRYLLAIWRQVGPNGEGWEAMRRELSVLYSRFYGILLGGILVMYEFHSFLRPIILDTTDHQQCHAGYKKTSAPSLYIRHERDTSCCVVSSLAHSSAFIHMEKKSGSLTCP